MMRRLTGRRNPDCFSLLELLAAMAVIAVLVAVLSPALSGVRERARRVQCMSNLRQIGLAEHQYASDHGGDFYQTGGPSLGGTLGASNGAAWQGLSNYIVSAQVMFCPSALKVDVGFTPANQMTNTWDGITSVHNHYGYVCYMNAEMEAKQILAFETPNYYFHRRDFGFNTFAPASPPYDYLEIMLGTGEAYKSDGTTLFMSGPYPDTPTAHGKEGSNVLFVDGRVEWAKGPKIGRFYVYALPDVPGHWWPAGGWGCIVVY